MIVDYDSGEACEDNCEVDYDCGEACEENCEVDYDSDEGCEDYCEVDYASDEGCEDNCEVFFDSDVGCEDNCEVYYDSDEGCEDNCEVYYDSDEGCEDNCEVDYDTGEGCEVDYDSGEGCEDNCEVDYDSGEGFEDNCEVDYDTGEGCEAGPGLGLVAGGWRKKAPLSLLDFTLAAVYRECTAVQWAHSGVQDGVDGATVSRNLPEWRESELGREDCIAHNWNIFIFITSISTSQLPSSLLESFIHFSQFNPSYCCVDNQCFLLGKMKNKKSVRYRGPPRPGLSRDQTWLVIICQHWKYN